MFLLFSLAVVLVPQMYGLPLIYQQFLRELWETMKSIRRLQKVGVDIREREGETVRVDGEGGRKGGREGEGEEEGERERDGGLFTL